MSIKNEIIKLAKKERPIENSRLNYIHFKWIHLADDYRKDMSNKENIDLLEWLQFLKLLELDTKIFSFNSEKYSYLMENKIHASK